MLGDPAPSPSPDSTPRLTRPQRRVGSFALKVLLGAVVIGMVAAALITGAWPFYLVAVAFVIPYILLLSAPFWLARGSEEHNPPGSAASQPPVAPQPGTRSAGF